MLIVISLPNRIRTDNLLINELFKSGLQTFHLRKPDFNKEDYEELLKAISPEYKKKIVLHQYHELAKKYNVKGLHLREEHRESMTSVQLKDLKKELQTKSLTLSSSFHSMENLRQADGIFDYVFLSPVFDSISKPGYVSSCVLQVEYKLKTTKVIALGGIQANNISEAKKLGFDGVAALGAIWQDPEKAEIKFKELQIQYSNHFINS